jgi:hypothetical protein
MTDSLDCRQVREVAPELALGVLAGVGASRGAAAPGRLQQLPTACRGAGRGGRRTTADPLPEPPWVRVARGRAARLQRRHPALGPVLGGGVARRRLPGQPRWAAGDPGSLRRLRHRQLPVPRAELRARHRQLQGPVAGHRPVGASRQGSALPPTNPAAFLGRFAPARATGSFSGRSWGSASGPTRGQLRRRVAELGPERNGVFLP